MRELNFYLIHVLKFSRPNAHKRVERLRTKMLRSASLPVIHALCRFVPWQRLGYRCVPIEGWVFAYEVYSWGVIIREMSHSSMLAEVN